MNALSNLIEALEDHLNSELAVPSLTVGVEEPFRVGDLPAITISLAQLVNPSRGLGAHRQVQRGALAARTEVNLSDPVLPDDATVVVLSPDRLTLTLFHGSLVDAEGSATPLQGSDIQVERNGVAFTLVSESPTAGEFTVNSAVGQLIFGEALPADGLLEAEYFIGQWERQIHQLRGSIVFDSVDRQSADAKSLSDSVYVALLNQEIEGLRELEVVSMGPVTRFGTTQPRMQIRTQEWEFDYETIVELPDASGGIIDRVRLLSSQDGSGLEEEDITLE
jgi:hypothetical protein